MAQFFVYLITSPNINWFSKFFHCQNQKTICNETVTTDPTTPQMCHYTTSWNIRWRTQACNATDRLRDQRWSSLACGISKQPRLKSSWLCCSGCPSTDGLSMLMIYDSQPAKESQCRSAATFVWLIAPLVIGVAGLGASSSSKANALNIWCENCEMWQLLWSIFKIKASCFCCYFLQCVISNIILFLIVAFETLIFY